METDLFGYIARSFEVLTCLVSLEDEKLDFEITSLSFAGSARGGEVVPYDPSKHTRSQGSAGHKVVAYFAWPAVEARNKVQRNLWRVISKTVVCVD